MMKGGEAGAQEAVKGGQAGTQGPDKNKHSGSEQQVVKPGSTVGLLGGGQLGRMMALAGTNLGYRFVTLDPTPDSPCGQVADQIVAAYSDKEAARELAQRADVITYEFENVDSEVAALLEELSSVPQGSGLLYTTQHRLREKRAIEAAGVQVAPYAEIRSEDELRAAVGRLGIPSVLKTATGGYDGKGQWVIRSEGEIAEAYETLSRSGAELVLEQFIKFEKELSVIAARSPRGEIRTFPAAENIHVDNILHISIVPARASAEIQAQAEELASRIAESLGAVGLLAVEMFLTADGQLYVNELAPRPHNSGHYTMEACTTSQFEQHVRAVCNLPLGEVKLLTPVVMVNVLGEHLDVVIERTADGAWLNPAAETGEQTSAVGTVATNGTLIAQGTDQMNSSISNKGTRTGHTDTDTDQTINVDSNREIHTNTNTDTNKDNITSTNPADIHPGGQMNTQTATGTGRSAGAYSVVPKVHLYGKSGSAPKRKMGHINLLCQDVQQGLDWIEQTKIWRSQQP